MPPEPQTAALLGRLAELSAGKAKSWELDPTAARANGGSLAALAGAGPSLRAVDERTISGPGGPLRLRLYRPADGPLPVIVWFHGGGMVLGDLETCDAGCRWLAEGAQVLVASVEYRLAPEHPFPAALEDGWAAAEWVDQHRGELGASDAPLAVGGDSAGGG